MSYKEKIKKLREVAGKKKAGWYFDGNGMQWTVKIKNRTLLLGVCFEDALETLKIWKLSSQEDKNIYFTYLNS